jgi:hypothetical protein
LPFQGLNPPFKRITERTGVLNEVLQLRRVSLSHRFIGGIDRSRMKFGNTGDVLVELFQTALDGGDLEWVGSRGSV